MQSSRHEKRGRGFGEPHRAICPRTARRIGLSARVADVRSTVAFASTEGSEVFDDAKVRGSVSSTAAKQKAPHHPPFFRRHPGLCEVTSQQKVRRPNRD